MPHQVFISHSFKDRVITDKVCDYLEQHGISCWVAPRDIKPGADWAESIVGAIVESKLVVLIFSQNSNDSTQINREINIGAEEGISILPFRIEDVPPSRKLRYYLSAPHWLDALPTPTPAHFERLEKSVRSFLPEKSTVHPPPSEGALNPPRFEGPVIPPPFEKPATIETPLPESREHNGSEVVFPRAAALSADHTPRTGIARFFSSLLSFDRGMLMEDLDGSAYLSKRKVIKRVGTAAFGWLVLTLLLTTPLAPGFAIFPAFLAVFLAFTIVSWILAYFAKTHLIYGLVSGTITSGAAAILVLLVNIFRLGPSDSPPLVFTFAFVILLLSWVSLFKEWVLLWISCGTLLFFFLLVGLFGYRSYDDLYLILLLIGIAGLVPTIFGIFKRRKGYVASRKMSQDHF